jgi:hypothetical protein
MLPVTNTLAYYAVAIIADNLKQVTNTSVLCCW